MLDRKIAQVMTKPPCCISPQDTIHLAAERMEEHGIGALPVCEGDRIVGIVTDRDITVRATAHGAAPDDCRCEDVMTRDVQCCRTDEACEDVLERMARTGVRRMPVQDASGRLVGMVALGDMVHQDAARAGRALDRISEPAAGHRT